MHCADPGCLKACPAPGAIVQYSNGIVDFVHENCIGCGYCIKGCPFNIPRISQGRPQGLQVHALLRPRRGRPGAGLRQGLPDPGDRLRHQGRDEGACAGQRIEDLKSRGFENAGLYDPPGVGGTHVMYVLHHADQPEIYAGLPKNPRISPIVELWKGVTKYAGLAAIGAFAGDRLPASPGDRAEPGHAGGRGGRRSGWPEGATMTAYDVEPGDEVHPGDPVTVDRYTAGARINHWITATCLVLLLRCPAWRCSIRACSS